MEDEEYCVFRQLGANSNSAERGCADKDDIKLKFFYNVTDTGCIVCKNLGEDKKEIDCNHFVLGYRPYDLDHNETVCFCKTNKCNQYEFKEELCCEKKNYLFDWYIFEMELCVDHEQCNPEIVSKATTNAVGVTTHVGSPNRTEFDGTTAVTESNGIITKDETIAGKTTTKQGNPTETETGGSKSTMEPNALQFIIAYLSTILSILTSVFAI